MILKISQTCKEKCTGECYITHGRTTYCCAVIKIDEDKYIRLDANSNKYIRDRNLKSEDIIKLLECQQNLEI